MLPVVWAAPLIFCGMFDHSSLEDVSVVNRATSTHVSRSPPGLTSTGLSPLLSTMHIRSPWESGYGNTLGTDTGNMNAVEHGSGDVNAVVQGSGAPGSGPNGGNVGGFGVH